MKLQIMPFVVVFFSTFHDNTVNCQKNNACKSQLGYYFIQISKDCYYIPDANNDVPEIIDRHIGLHEKYEVTTEDGYILDLFRIPRQNPKGVVLFQHPLSVDSKVWVSQYKESPAFIFWRAGYDVWLGNNRGTLYGKRHVNLTHTDRKFWDHSFHEMGLYDHTATIEYIKRKTNGSKIIFIGHSMSSTSSMVYASMRPKLAAESVKVIINMAPPVILKNIASPIIILQPIRQILQTLISEVLRIYSIFKHQAWYVILGRILIPMIPMKKWAIYFVCFFFGWTPENYDIQYFNMMVYQYGSEVSMNAYYHYGQIIHAGRFQMYDYGKKQNFKIYGNETPPLYPIEKIETPIYLIHSAQDIVSHPKDVELLYEKLPEQAKIYGKLLVKGLNHSDFLYGKNRNKNVYEKILELLHRIRKSENHQ